MFVNISKKKFVNISQTWPIWMTPNLSEFVEIIFLEAIGLWWFLKPFNIWAFPESVHNTRLQSRAKYMAHFDHSESICFEKQASLLLIAWLGCTGRDWHSHWPACRSGIDIKAKSLSLVLFMTTILLWMHYYSAIRGLTHVWDISRQRTLIVL